LLERIDGYRGAWLRPAAGLQKDFSLFHTLSLYLLDTLPKIPRDSETFALDLLSMVESIQENPDQILWKQLDRARGEAVARMKGEGIEYDERMKELENVEYPKPNRDFVYATFNEFADKHPWVGAENIRPKSVAREMAERFMTFGEYVREYELPRSEGLLLRYLTESYKTLVQSVPASYRDETVDDLIAFLRTTVRGVDSSLLDEWERLRDPTWQAAPLEALVRPVAPPPIWADARAFAARLRTELHRLVAALARKDELAPYFAEHDRIDQTPASRKPHQTFLKELEPRRWEAVQRLVDEAGEVDWMVQCEVDLSGAFDPDRPLLTLLRIGT
jgi:superfamily II RNA helicase